MEHHRLVSPAFAGMDCRMKIVGTDGQVEITAKGEVYLYNSDHAGQVMELPATQNTFADFAIKACSGQEPLVIPRALCIHAGGAHCQVRRGGECACRNSASLTAIGSHRVQA